MASWVGKQDLKQDLAVYVHWPFCASKCPYCDFNSHVVDTVNHERWAEALVRELNHMADLSERRGDVIAVNLLWRRHAFHDGASNHGSGDRCST